MSQIPINMQIRVRSPFICIFLIISTPVIIEDVNCQGISSPKVLTESPYVNQNNSDAHRSAINTDQSAAINADIPPLRFPKFTHTRVYDGVNFAKNDSRMFNLTEHQFLCFNLSKAPKEDGKLYCNATSDPFSCWPMTEGGHFAVISCPEVPGVDATKNATKFCFPNGTWMEKANYNACLSQGITVESDNEFQGELATDYVSRIIYNLGFTISTVALAIALFIFLYFRSLRCLRNIIHCHLIVTFILRNIIWIIMQHSLLPIVNSQETWACKLEVAIFNYAQMTNFFWMLVEGLYLHIIIVWTYSADKIKRWYFIVIGWGIPLVIMAIWVALRVYSDSTEKHKVSVLLDCWLPPNNSNHGDDLDYIYVAPTLLVLAVNMLFLATIIWVLVTKLRASNSLETKQLRKAVKATLLLLPLLGITYLLFIWPPTDHKAVVEAHKFINTFLQSFQGFFVALFYCFLNGEVKSVLKKKFSTFRENRTLATRYTKTSIGWANDITIHKDHMQLTNGKRNTSANSLEDRRVSNNNSCDGDIESERML
ncbi:corticotropin-releasing factor receptor 1-like [Saccostrea cucullata]|uniref:corticotropin-releasing factor receptor 1-like n=1 Tax=Saccostrea cuccullata TaxID=36930 RepID=UPI002ED5F37E